MKQAAVQSSAAGLATVNSSLNDSGSFVDPGTPSASGKKDMNLGRQPAVGWSISTRKKEIASLKN
jgi:hypothetical protein